MLIGVAIAAGALLALGVVGMFWLGFRSGVGGLHVSTVSPAILAQAMSDDSFYSDYNQTTLIIHAPIIEASSGEGETTIAFSAGGTRVVSCQLPSGPSLKQGQIVTVVAEGATAVRHPDGVMLPGCAVLAPAES